LKHPLGALGINFSTRRQNFLRLKVIQEIQAELFTGIEVYGTWRLSLLQI